MDKEVCIQTTTYTLDHSSLTPDELEYIRQAEKEHTDLRLIRVERDDSSLGHRVRVGFSKNGLGKVIWEGWTKL